MRSQIFYYLLWSIRLSSYSVVGLSCNLSHATEIEASYSLVGALLTAPVKGGDGFRQLGSTTSGGSSFNMKASWGEKWYQGIGVDLHSTAGLLPTGFDIKDNVAVNASAFAARLGLAPFRLSYSQREFGSLGEVTEAGKLRKNNVPLEPGEKLEFGSKVELLTLQWLFKLSVDETPASKILEYILPMYYLIGSGAGRIETRGIRGVNPLPGTQNEFEFGSVEEIERSVGGVIELSASTLPHNFSIVDTKGNRFYWKYEIDAFFSGKFNDAMQYLKQGTTLGNLTYIGQSMFLHLYAGAYTWQLATPQEGFEGVQTTNGAEAGLTLGAKW